MIRVLIVDDEAPARDKLRRWLAAQPRRRARRGSADGLAAAAAIDEARPDVVFLDIQMPGLSGLEVAAQLETETAPLIVFVTAYDEHAIKAFELNAVDYLLKPYDSDRLRKTLERLRERRGAALAPPRRCTQRALQHGLERAPAGAARRALELIEARAHPLARSRRQLRPRAHRSRPAYMVRRTLADLLAQLGERFVRIHKSTAVNIARSGVAVAAVQGRPRSASCAAARRCVSAAASRTRCSPGSALPGLAARSPHGAPRWPQSSPRAVHGGHDSLTEASMRIDRAIRLPRLAARARRSRLLLFFHTGMLFVGWGWHITNAETDPGAAAADGHRASPAHAAAVRDRRRRHVVRAAAAQSSRAAARTDAAPARARDRRHVPDRAAAGVHRACRQRPLARRLSGFLRAAGAAASSPTPPATSAGTTCGSSSIYMSTCCSCCRCCCGGARGVRRDRGSGCYLLALPLGINEALLKPRFPETHNLVSDWYIFNHYLLLTVYGFALASMRDAWDWLAQWRRVSLAAAIVLLVGGLALLELGIIARDTPADALFANVFTWVWLMVFLGYGRQHLSGSNRWLAWAREASYPIYILHQTVIIAVALFVIQQSWSPGSKYWLVLGTTILICVLLYEGVLRRLAMTRVLFGIKARRASAPGR